MSWLGTYVVRSTDGGNTRSAMIPVNARPLKHAGCRLGCWTLPDGGLLMGVYARIRGYGEEDENESTRSALLRSDDGGVPSSVNPDFSGVYQHIGYPSAAVLASGTVVCLHHEHTDDDHKLQHVRATRFRVA